MDLSGLSVPDCQDRRPFPARLWGHPWSGFVAALLFCAGFFGLGMTDPPSPRADDTAAASGNEVLDEAVDLGADALDVSIQLETDTAEIDTDAADANAPDAELSDAGVTDSQSDPASAAAEAVDEAPALEAAASPGRDAGGGGQVDEATTVGSGCPADTQVCEED